tara:strand:- start:1687 stop:2139 length:453 start_codon:yes stop_codon:yes gene_type:complete
MRTPNLNKHYNLRLKGAELLATMSPCPRGQVGAVIFNPNNYVIIADGYSGPPRKGGELCGGDTCTRTCESGTQIQTGCHHAEMNAICNAARLGAKTLGAAIAITCQPCLMCAKLIHHAGIELVIYKEKPYAYEGLKYLKERGVKVLAVVS